MAGAVGRTWKRRTQQCSVCRKHFEPNPRVGRRQRTCGRGECKREHRRRRSAEWHAAHPDYDKVERLRARLLKAPEVVSDAVGEESPDGPDGGAAVPQVDWALVRTLMGTESGVIVEESHQVAIGWARTLMPPHVPRSKGEAR